MSEQDTGGPALEFYPPPPIAHAGLMRLIQILFWADFRAYQRRVAAMLAERKREKEDG